MPAHGVTTPEVLHDVSFTAPFGKLTALVGPSGAGKSTVLSLAARFYDPTRGTVSLDGVSLGDLSREELRREIAVVTQDVFLFHATLRDNIAFGAPGAAADALDAAVDAAQLHDLIQRLPDGLETVVGERGFRLSGGEKQRVSIARALLRHAPYLLLDEATSSLDSQAERRLQAALAQLIEGRTVIAIAHRLSTIQRADQILVVDAGRIVERGTTGSCCSNRACISGCTPRSSRRRLSRCSSRRPNADRFACLMFSHFETLRPRTSASAL